MGVGFAGPVDADAGMVITSHQVDGWDSFALADWCQGELKRPTALGNDADLAGLGEARFGAGRAGRIVFYSNAGSGIGGALVVDGVLYRGASGVAAEIGRLRPGLLFDRLKAIRAAGLAFITLALFPISLYLAWSFTSQPLAYVAFVFYGVAMAGVWQAWNLGAMHFTGDKEAAPFQVVHLTAVGIRGLIAPWIGLGLFELLGFGGVYITAAGLMLFSGLLMFLLGRSRTK